VRARTGTALAQFERAYEHNGVTLSIESRHGSSYGAALSEGMEREGTHHESLEIGAPPLSETIADLPVIVDTVRGVELARVRWGGETFV